VAGPRRKPARRHRIDHAVKPALARRQLHRTGDRAYAPMTKVEQVVDGLPSGRPIVYRDRIGAVAFDRSTQKNGGDAIELMRLILIGRAHRHQNHSVATKGPNSRQDAPLRVGLFIAVEEDE
jgi:hypothetical protein